MSGAKTRFGFAGDGSEPPGSDEARGARTIIGRDIHLPVSRGQAQPAPPPQASQPAGPARVFSPPAPRVPTPMSQAAVPSRVPDEETAELPSRRSRPRQSRLARFIGRWTKSGRFVASSEAGRDGNDAHHEDHDDLHDADLQIPRDPLARNVLLVLVVALVTFFLTLLLVKVRQHATRSAAEHGTTMVATGRAEAR